LDDRVQKQLKALEAVDFSNRPDIFVEDILGAKLWYRQREILDSVWQYQQTYVPTGNSVGKTWLAGRLALAFFYCWAWTQERVRVIIVGAKFDQLRMQTWAEVRAAYTNSKFPLGGDLRARELFLNPQSQDSYVGIFGTDKDSPERIQGFHAPHLLIISEESSSLEGQIAEALESCCTSANSHMLFIGNPLHNHGFFHDRCTDPRNEDFKRDKIRNVIQVQTLEAPPHVADPKWVESKRQEWGENSTLWQVRILGQFPSSGEDAVIPLEAVEAAFTKERIDYIRPDNQKRAIAMDIARGEDDSVIMGLSGDYVNLVRCKKTPNTETATDWFIEAIRDFGGKSVIDENGLGGGPYDRIRNAHIPIRGFIAQRKAANQERFANLKSEVLFSLRQRFIDGMIAIPESKWSERMKSDLAGYTWKFDNKGRIQTIDPPRSPDFGDTLIMAHWGQTRGISHLALETGGEGAVGRSAETGETIVGNIFEREY